jgi:hypothetical protein
MENKNKNILNELKNKGHGFVSPSNYFTEFEQDFYANNKNIKSGYNSPDNYFDHLEDKIIKETKGFNTKRTTGFKIPDNYFKTLDNVLIDKQNSKIIKLNNYNYFKIISLSIAASLLLFVGINNSKSKTDNINLESINIVEIENWMENDLISFNTYEISDIFTDNDLDILNNETDEILDYFEYNDLENLILEN